MPRCKYQLTYSATLENSFRYPFTPNRAIIITWFVVTISAIPVGLSHGIVEYYNHKNEINTACLFLTDEGYNHAAFQVRSKEREKTNYLWRKATQFCRFRTKFVYITTHRHPHHIHFFADFIFSLILHRSVDIDLHSLCGDAYPSLAHRTWK